MSGSSGADDTHLAGSTVVGGDVVVVVGAVVVVVGAVVVVDDDVVVDSSTVVVVVVVAVSSSSSDRSTMARPISAISTSRPTMIHGRRSRGSAGGWPVGGGPTGGCPPVTAGIAMVGSLTGVSTRVGSP